MELGWFLMGLTYACRAEGQLRQFEPPRVEPYRLLQATTETTVSRAHGQAVIHWPESVRGHVGSFADQVYPIFAMAHFGQVFGVKEALQNSLDAPALFADCKVLWANGGGITIL